MSNTVCEAGQSGREELKITSPSLAVLWNVNISERKTRYKTIIKIILKIKHYLLNYTAVIFS